MKRPIPSVKTRTQIGMLILVVSAILFSSAARARNWPRFRGPNGQGISHAKNIPAKWTQDDYNWKVDISYTNDEWVDALSIPLQLIGGKTRLMGDSAVYTGGRVEKFDYKGFRADTAIQCVTMGLVANLGPNKNSLPPGKGRLVTLFVSSVDKKPITEFTVDTTFTRPNNTLMVIAKRIQPGEPPDTLGLDREADKQIIPVFVVRKPE